MGILGRVSLPGHTFPWESHCNECPGAIKKLSCNLQIPTNICGNSKLVWFDRRSIEEGENMSPKKARCLFKIMSFRFNHKFLTYSRRCLFAGKWWKVLFHNTGLDLRNFWNLFRLAIIEIDTAWYRINFWFIGVTSMQIFLLYNAKC